MKRLLKGDGWFWITLIIGMICLTVVDVAKAEDVTLSWTNPDRTFTMTDAGPYTNPAGTKIYLEVADTASATDSSIVIPAMKPGTYNFVAVSYDADGVASPVSSPATKEVTQWVTVATQAKIVAKIPGDFLLLVVGTVPLGTPCNPDVSVKGHYAIDAAAVTFTGAEDVLVVAECG